MRTLVHLCAVLLALALIGIGFLLNSKPAGAAEIDNVPPLFCETASQMEQLVAIRNKTPGAKQRQLIWSRAINEVNGTLGPPKCFIADASAQIVDKPVATVLIEHRAYQIVPARVFNIDYNGVRLPGPFYRYILFPVRELQASTNRPTLGRLFSCKKHAVRA